MTDSKVFFQSALPVWIVPLKSGANHRLIESQILVFSCNIPPSSGEICTLKIAGWTSYRVWLGSEFVHYGPARSAKEFFRVEDIQLGEIKQSTQLTIEVVSYNVEAFSYPLQPPFLQTEVLIGGRACFWTGDGYSFKVSEEPYRLRKVQRYSYMRGFSEAYDFRESQNSTYFGTEVVPILAHKKKLLTRNVKNCSYDEYFPQSGIFEFVLKAKSVLINYKRDRCIDLVGSELGGVLEKDWETRPWFEWQEFEFDFEKESVAPPEFFSVSTQTAKGFEWQSCQTGLIKIEFETSEETRFWIAFDELPFKQAQEIKMVDPLRGNCLNILEFDVGSGKRLFFAAEPYTFKSCAIVVLQGELLVHKISVIGIEHPYDQVIVPLEDQNEKLIEESAIRTLRQNSFDLFMDCPGRERAGYLCDSYFTSIPAHYYFQGIDVETSFLENFAIAKTFENIPKGMMPMCYPSDALETTHIPQWPMWLIIQLSEFLERGGSQQIVDRFQVRIEDFLNYIFQFEGQNGFISKVPGWNFIEWSEANEWTEGINVPTNMLFCQALESAGRLYHRPEWTQKGGVLRKSIVEFAFDGHLMHDQLDPVTLQSTGHHSGVCQHGAFFHKIFDPEEKPEFWEFVVKNLGDGKYPDSIARVNMLTGWVMRWKLLFENGEKNRMKAEILNDCLPMAQETGTIWENTQPTASCCHGFASIVGYFLRQSQ